MGVDNQSSYYFGLFLIRVNTFTIIYASNHRGTLHSKGEKRLKKSCLGFFSGGNWLDSPIFGGKFYYMYIAIFPSRKSATVI